MKARGVRVTAKPLNSISVDQLAREKQVQSR
jgi:hypothetical protein